MRAVVTAAGKQCSYPLAEDSTCDNWGAFCYIRDLDNGEFWSTSYQPTQKEPKNYEAVFSTGAR